MDKDFLSIIPISCAVQRENLVGHGGKFVTAPTSSSDVIP